MSGSVTFLTLFLSLLTGPQAVTVAVEGEVARVELRLDGESMGFVDSEPWTLTCDFGDDLEPHELVAIGYDRRGREIARAKQLINLPRARAEARFALDDRGDGPPESARLTWSTVENLRPQSIAIEFDDRPLSFDDPDRIRLPSYDPRQPHFLSAELTFGGDLEARTLTSFGGQLGLEVSTELTAVPIVAADRRAPPPARAMSGWFYKRDSPIPVFAVEKTPADVLMVVDHRAWTELREIYGPAAVSRPVTVERQVSRRSPFPGRRWQPGDGLPPGLRKGDRFRFVATFPTLLTGADQDKLLFPVGDDLNAEDQRIAIASAMLRATPPEQDRSQSLAYAVAVAARTAAAGEGPRAVILVVTDNPADASGLSSANVRGYLEKLRVPLHVWRTSVSPAATGWGHGTEITTSTKLKAALKSLRRDLDRQYVVWLEGSHLPQDVELRHGPWKIAG